MGCDVPGAYRVEVDGEEVTLVVVSVRGSVAIRMRRVEWNQIIPLIDSGRPGVGSLYVVESIGTQTPKLFR